MSLPSLSRLLTVERMLYVHRLVTLQEGGSLVMFLLSLPSLLASTHADFNCKKSYFWGNVWSKCCFWQVSVKCLVFLKKKKTTPPASHSVIRDPRWSRKKSGKFSAPLIRIHSTSLLTAFSVSADAISESVGLLRVQDLELTYNVGVCHSAETARIQFIL